MRFSASKAGLLAACRYPFRDGTPWEESRGQAAIQGDDFHKRIASVVDPTVPTVDKPVTTKWLRERMAHAEAWIAKNRVAEWRAEEAFGYSPDAGVGRSLGFNIDRKYAEVGLRDDEIGGSADISCLEGDCAASWDWKSGRFITEATWAQMDVIALMSARARKAWSARATILHVTDRGIEEQTRTYSDVDLWVIAETLRRSLAAVEDSWPDVGNHCTACFCPARAGCDLYQLTKKENAA